MSLKEEGLQKCKGLECHLLQIHRNLSLFQFHCLITFRDYPGDAGGIPMKPVKLANGGAQDHRSR